MTSARPAPDRLALLVHEVRSPVAALTAIAEAVRDDALDRDSLRELARLASRACRSIERIVGDAAVGSIRPQRIELRGLLEDAVTAAVLAGARVRLVRPSDLLLQADPVRLRQAVDNLIGNALVHAGPEADVVVHTATDAEFVRISVSDTGRGIPLRDQEDLFQAGVRLDDEGSGLGLAIVREIAEAHGGTASVDSDVGKGATFTIALPRRLD